MKYTIHQIATRPLLLAFCLGLSFFVVLTAKGQGRAPAVLNEKGLSIEERKHTPPDQAKEFGYDFEKEHAQGQLKNADAQTISEGLKRQAKIETSSIMVAFSMFILALPLMVWFGLMNQLKKDRKQNSEVSGTAPVANQKPISLEEFRSKQKDSKNETKTKDEDTSDKNNKNLPKAS